MLSNYKLTQYSHGAGCGCKISPSVLDLILQHQREKTHFPALLVGNEERDDAAVFDLGDGTGIISTTDFFMPIVDDPFDFGQIASVNAISDIYAMGGVPLMAIAILGWPINVLPAELANAVVEGSRAACRAAGIPLAGGHSIDSPEPVFGLAVTGRVDLSHLKKNGGASPGSTLFLTKPIGVGIFTTAEKKGLLRAEDKNLARNSMLRLNSVGAEFGALPYVQAMTDVTGFGLLGHLLEMCVASGTKAKIELARVPLLSEDAIEYYLGRGCIPGGTKRNFDSYGHKIAPLTEIQRNILCDPQTSGGLLVAVAAGKVEEFQQYCTERGYFLAAIGEMFDGGGEEQIEVC